MRRLLVVSRRFWPLCDESCHRLVNWASMLQRQGFEVTVLTGRWHSSWPAESDCREVHVVRLLPAPKSSWTETLFLRNMATWITKHRKEFDAIYVDESRSLLHQIGSPSTRGDVPVIARFEGVSTTMATGNHAMTMIAQAADACRKASLVVAPNAMAHRQLQASGIASDRIVRIPDVVSISILRESEARRSAAAALRKVNQDMAVPNDTKLLTYIGNLDVHANLSLFIRAAIAELDRGRRFRVWLVGDGRELRSLYDLVKNASFHHDILFHSPFDNLEELFQVSDAIVCPEAGFGEEFVLPSAIASGIPIIALDSTIFRSAIPSSLHDSLLTEPTQRNFEQAIQSCCEDWETWRQNAEAARREWVASHFIENAMNLWFDLFLRGMRNEE
jgi:glycosyltransferase involved in cell wall biosynthesis